MAVKSRGSVVHTALLGVWLTLETLCHSSSCRTSLVGRALRHAPRPASEVQPEASCAPALSPVSVSSFGASGSKAGVVYHMWQLPHSYREAEEALCCGWPEEAFFLLRYFSATVVLPEVSLSKQLLYCGL